MDHYFLTIKWLPISTIISQAAFRGDIVNKVSASLLAIAVLTSVIISIVVGLLGFVADASVPMAILYGLGSFATCLTLALSVIKAIGPADPTGHHPRR